MNSFIKKNINFIIGILIGIVCLILWFIIIDFDEFLKYFHKFDLKFVLMFSFFYILAYFLRSLRWKIILSPIYNMKVLESFRIFMAGMLLNYLIPIRAGELAKSFILKKNKGIGIAKTLPSIFIDKMTDLFPIMIILVLIPLITVQLNRALYTIIFLLLFIYIAFLGFLFFAVNHKHIALKFTDKLLFIFPKKYKNRLEFFFFNFVEGMSVMKGRIKDYVIVYGLTVLAVLSESLYIYAVFYSFGASNTTYLRIMFGYTLMNLTYILPTPPVQIGSNQFLWVLIFSFALGIDKNLTSAAVVFSHFLTSIWIFLIGGISFSVIGVKIKEAFRQSRPQKK